MSFGQMHQLSQLFMVVAVVFAIVSVILFFVLDIKTIWKLSHKRFVGYSKVQGQRDPGVRTEKKPGEEKTDEKAVKGRQNLTEPMSTVYMSAGCLPTEPLIQQELVEDTSNNGTRVLEAPKIKIIQDITYM